MFYSVLFSSLFPIHDFWLPRRLPPLCPPSCVSCGDVDCRTLVLLIDVLDSGGRGGKGRGVEGFVNTVYMSVMSEDMTGEGEGVYLPIF